MTTNRVLLTGATGMIGGHALQFCLDNESVSKTTSIGRRSVGEQNPKLTEITHETYADYSEIGDAFAMVLAGLHGTGTHTAQVLENSDIRAIAEAHRV